MVEVTDSSSVSTTEKSLAEMRGSFFVFATSPLAKAKKARGQDAQAIKKARGLPEHINFNF